MISAIDSSVILDVVTDDPTHAEMSEGVLRRASIEGQLVVCECVLAEIYPAFGAIAPFEEFLSDWQFDIVPSSRESATLARELFSRYLNRGGKKGRIVADFLIGAHARVHADRLVARDRGYLRDYFAELLVWDPAQPPISPEDKSGE